MSGLVVAKRLAIKLQPPTIFLEYSSVDSDFRRVRAVKLSNIHSRYSSDLDKLTDKVIKGFPKDLDQGTINRQQIQGLLAQLLLSIHESSTNTSSITKELHTLSSCGGGPIAHHSVARLNSCSQATLQQRQCSKQLVTGSRQVSAEHGFSGSCRAPVQVCTTSRLGSHAPGWTPDNQDSCGSQQQRQQRASVRGAVDSAACCVSEQQQSSSSCEPLPQQLCPADNSGVQCDLLSALSDIQAELDAVDGSAVGSLNQLSQQRPVEPCSCCCTVGTTANDTATTITAAVVSAGSSTAAEQDDATGCLTLAADFLIGEHIDLGKATEYELRLAKAEMDKKFRQNMVQPGQPGYVYDKQADFQPAVESNEWDED